MLPDIYLLIRFSGPNCCLFVCLSDWIICRSQRSACIFLISISSSISGVDEIWFWWDFPPSSVIWLILPNHIWLALTGCLISLIWMIQMIKPFRLNVYRMCKTGNFVGWFSIFSVLACLVCLLRFCTNVFFHNSMAQYEPMVISFSFASY